MLLEVANAATDALPRAETRNIDMLAVAEMRNAETQEGRWPGPRPTNSAEQQVVLEMIEAKPSPSQSFGKRWRRVLVLACLSVVITLAVVAGLSTDEAVTTTTTAVGCVVIVLLAWVICSGDDPIPPAEDAATQTRSAELREQAALAVAQVADADTHAIPEVTDSEAQAQISAGLKDEAAQAQLRPEGADAASLAVAQVTGSARACSYSCN